MSSVSGFIVDETQEEKYLLDTKVKSWWASTNFCSRDINSKSGIGSATPKIFATELLKLCSWDSLRWTSSSASFKRAISSRNNCMECSLIVRSCSIVSPVFLTWSFNMLTLRLYLVRKASDSIKRFCSSSIFLPRSSAVIWNDKLHHKVGENWLFVPSPFTSEVEIKGKD